MADPRKNLAMLAMVEEALIRGIPCEMIQEQCAAHYGCSPHTVRHYITYVRTRWEREEEADRPHRRAELRKRLEKSFRVALDGSDAVAMASLLRTWAKFDGLESPKVHNHHHVVDVRAMSPAQRREEIEELIRMRDRSRREQRPSRILEGKCHDPDPNGNGHSED